MINYVPEHDYRGAIRRYLKLKVIKMLLNYLFDNEVIFYSMFVGMGGFIEYKFVTSYFDSFYVDKGVQTSA